MSGSGSFSYNGKSFALVKNDIAVISRPRLVADIRTDSEFTCRFIAAPDKFLHSLLPANNYAIQGSVSLFDNPIIEVSEDEALIFIRDVERICERLGDINHRFYSEMMGSLLQTMIYDLFDFHVRRNDSMLTTDRVGSIVSGFFALMHSGRPRTEREVSYYADKLNVSPKYLSDTVKRVTGVNVSTHINRIAVAIMLEYLKDNKYSITQIADEMKFASVSYFSRYCTKHTGMSPSQYRAAGDKGR